MEEMIGKWAFIVGILVAVVAGVVTINPITFYVPLILLVLGLVVGFLNIGDKETTEFLIATIVLIVGANAALNAIPAIGPFLAKILTNIVGFAWGAALVVALKAVYTLAKNR